MAVGAMASSSELRSPNSAMRARSACQRSGSDGVTPQCSGCKRPRAAWVWANAGWAPSRAASSTDVSSAVR